MRRRGEGRRAEAGAHLTVIFLDFEASSLMRGSYPIEIGWAPVGGDVEAHLIAPAPGWTEWSYASQAIHGLTQDDLILKGRPVAEVAARTLEVLGAPGAVVVSDNPRWEQMWLGRLLAAADVDDHGIVVQDATDLYVTEARRLLALAPPEESASYRHVRGALLDEVNDMLRECQCAETQRRRPRHRAGPDAEGMRWIYEQIRCRVDARLSLG